MKRLSIIIVFLMSGICSFAQLTKQRESYYQKIFAESIHGKMEVVLDDKARVDIVIDSFAIEVDFSEKWAESIGQSLYYAEKLHKRAGVLLVVDGYNDNVYINRLMTVAVLSNITVWLIDYNTDKWYRLYPVISYKYNFN